VSRDKDAGQNQFININKKSFEKMEQFKYLGTTKQLNSSIREEIKSKMETANACYYTA